jgi:hypothetical protein
MKLNYKGSSRLSNSYNSLLDDDEIGESQGYSHRYSQLANAENFIKLP